MHIISKIRLKEFWLHHPDAESSLRTWYKLASSAAWENFVQLRDLFPAADLVGNFTVFNIGGNKYRLIALVDYNYQKVFVRYILTHTEYDDGGWKNDDWY